MRDKSWINSRKLKEKVILGLAFEKNWRKIGANVTLQKIIRENRDNFELIRRNAEGKKPIRRGMCTAGRGAQQACRGAPPRARVIVPNKTSRNLVPGAGPRASQPQCAYERNDLKNR